MAKVNWLARDYSNWDVNPPTLARMQTATFFIDTAVSAEPACAKNKQENEAKKTKSKSQAHIKFMFY